MQRRHDEKAWTPLDAERAALAHEPLPFRICITEHRGDLPERASMAGMKTHRGFLPCMSCCCAYDTLHDDYALCRTTLPWQPRTHRSYMQELKNQIIEVFLPDEAARNLVVGDLVFKQSWPWGRVVNGSASVVFGLIRGDKLVIGGAITDIHALDTVETPAKVFFFRLQRESGIAGMSLMWDVPGVHSYGIKYFTLERFVDCTLHTIDLGVIQRWIGESLMMLLRLDIFDLGLPTVQDTLQEGSVRLRQRLKAWYRSEVFAHPEKCPQ